MQQNPRLADIPPARSPHNEQGCSEWAHAVDESEAGLAVKLAPRSLSHPPRARQPLFFPHPTALSLSANRSEQCKDKGVAAAAATAPPIYAIALSFRWAFIFLHRFCCCRESPEKVFYLHLLYALLRHSKPERPSFYLLSKLCPVIRESEIKCISLEGGIFQRAAARLAGWTFEIQLGLMMRKNW